MTNLIIRLFIRNWKNTDDPKVRTAYGKVAGMVGIVTNLILSAAKLTIGIIFNSIAIMADAVNNLTDSASSVVTMVGFKLASKPADKEHPYGHARIEYIAGLIVSIIVFVLGFELGRSSLDKILSPEETGFNFVVIGILGGSILTKLWQCLFYRKMGKSINSTTLKATSVDSLNDVISTSVVLGGSILSHFIGFNLDGYLGMAVAAFIMFSGVRLIIETSNPLLGAAPSEDMMTKLKKIFESHEQILGYHDLQFHDYGEQMYFATVHFEMDSSSTLDETHAIIDKIERQVRSELNVQLVVHLDPIAVGHDETNYLHDKIDLLINEIAPELSMHDFHVEWGERIHISFDLVAPYHFCIKDDDLKDMVERKILNLDDCYDVDLVVEHR